MTDGSLRPQQTVLVKEDRIATIGPASEVDVPAGARVVDAEGGYLVPGLWDMHVHAVRKERARYFWPLLRAYGVTGIRDMGASVEKLRQRMAQARHPRSGAPRIHWSSPMIDGEPPVYDMAYTVTEAAEVPAALDAMEELGVDFLKIYDRLPREVYFALAEEARKRGVPFAGHVPNEVTSTEASGAGQKSFEHPMALLVPCIPGAAEGWAALTAAGTAHGPDSKEAAQAQQRMVGALAFGAPDPALCRPLLERMAANGTWWTPTLILLKGALTPSSLEDDPRMRYVPADVAETWRSERRLTPEQEAQLGRKILDNGMRLVDLAHDAGVRILAGSDASNEPYIFVGSGLHDELALLVEAGLSPLEALRAATLGPAEYMDRRDELGTVEEGKLADLVLLAANPLEDIENVRRIRAVVFDGELFDRTSLDTLLEEAENAL